MSATQPFTVGRATVAFDTAVRWLRAYSDTEANLRMDKPYAYPAYDAYAPGKDPDSSVTQDGEELSDGDFLAPVLLNVRMSIRAYYGLQRIRGLLQEALTPIDPNLDLVDADDDTIDTLVRPLYLPLEDERTRPKDVRVTTLSKVLHRKRPRFLLLHDSWVKACYYGDGAPVPRDRGLHTADYMAALTRAAAADLRNQRDRIDELVVQVPTAAPLSRARVLDILAWTCQGKDA